MAEVRGKEPSQPGFTGLSRKCSIRFHSFWSSTRNISRRKFSNVLSNGTGDYVSYSWRGDGGNLHVNRGFRIQMNSAMGRKGGLRFITVNRHPQVSRLEQVFKMRLRLCRWAGRRYSVLIERQD